LTAALREYSELHDSVKALRARQKTLLAQIQKTNEETEQALSAALVAYVEKLQYERPTNSRMLAFRARVLLPLNELADLTACSDWDNRIAALETWERVLQAKGAVVDAGLASDIKMVLIQPGEFTMGSSDGYDSEKPPHTVKITKPFYLSVTEVTQGQYERVMGTNPSRFKGDPRRPVENVSWQEAVEFCRKLSEQEGRTYRLPTEAEWEYACRAGSKTKWSFGDDESAVGDYAWYDDNSGSTTHPVGEKKPNAWGLYDMHGNVWEWCSDGYGEYEAGVVSDPTGTESASARVGRGGGWRYSAAGCRSAYRLRYSPSVRSDALGFRLAAVQSPR